MCGTGLLHIEGGQKTFRGHHHEVLVVNHNCFEGANVGAGNSKRCSLVRLSSFVLFEPTAA
jgi:hypothetical protein